MIRFMRKLVLGGSTCAFLMVGSHASAADKRAWSVRDSIETTYFVSAERSAGVYSIITAEVVPSPDERRFFVITKRGDLSDDSNVYRIEVYDVPVVRKALERRSKDVPQPVRTQTIRSRASMNTLEPGLFDIRWTDDSAALTYIEAAGDEHAQVRRWDLDADRVTKLTHAEFGVENYKFENDVLVFNARMRSRKKSESEIYEYPITWMRQPQWAAAMGFYEMPLYAMFARFRDGKILQLLEPRSSSFASHQTAFISPGAKTAVVAGVSSQSELPAHWSGYRNSATGVQFSDVRQFFIVDLATGERRAALDAPTGNLLRNQTEPQALWYDDSRVVLINTMLPLGGESDAQREVTSYLLDYDMSTGEYAVIGEMPAGRDARFPAVLKARWVKPGREFLLEEYGYRDRPATLYTRTGNRWSMRQVPAPERAPRTDFEGMRVEIRQGLNDPPRLVASNASHELQLSARDPVLEGVRRLPAEWIEWRDGSGNARSGILVQPTSERPIGGYPLILQFVDIERNQFLPDGGTWRPGFAAQAMAARGFAVLSFDPAQVGGRSVSPEETKDVLAGANSAVALLRDRGLIDPKRVGVMGFSRMGYRALYVATHPRQFVPAAAMVQDSFDASYGQYLSSSALMEKFESDQFDGMYAGGKLFWENKQAWLEDAPGFNLDRMQTPLLVTNHYAPFTGGLVGLLETYGALRALQRPVDVVVYPRGDHVLQLPRQREAAMELAIDWMSFWIKGEECDDPSHVEAHKHWHELRANWKQSGQPAASNQSNP